MDKYFCRNPSLGLSALKSGELLGYIGVVLGSKQLRAIESIKYFSKKTKFYRKKYIFITSKIALKCTLFEQIYKKKLLLGPKLKFQKSLY